MSESRPNISLPAFDLEPRACGDCHACCVVPEIEHLGKPARVPCRHLCDEGCRVYVERGEVCRSFRCLWLEGAMGAGNRPDKLGVMFNLIELDAITPAIVATEVLPGALQQGIPQWILASAMIPATGLVYLQPVDGGPQWAGTEEKTSRAKLIERVKRLEAEQAAKESAP